MVLLAATLAAGCGPQNAPADDPTQPAPTRGYILISLDSVAAGHLGAYGYGRDTTPFFDRLAQRGLLFETALAQSPSTLISHLSMLTGLYPPQHGVTGPRQSLSPEIDWLPERFSHYGFVTAGHTEGGLLSREYGFHRGFDEFSDSFGGSGREIENTLESGLAFLRGLAPRQRFFLFLHSYSAHAPYAPPSGYASLFLGSGTQASDIGDLDWRAVNAGFASPEPGQIESAKARYDAGLRYLDATLERFFTELEELELLDETTIVITADHGEEFFEHRRLGHTQVYPEVLHVPLLVLSPAIETGGRIDGLVELIDVAPTLYDLAGIPVPSDLSGESLTPRFSGRSENRTWAYAESRERFVQRTLVSNEDRAIHQVVATSLLAERDGVWVTRSAGFETSSPDVDLSVASFHRPRRVRVTLEGDELHIFEAGPGWTQVALPLPSDRTRYRLDFSTDGCDSPRQLELSDDPRCLSFKLRGLDPTLRELFRLDHDPRAAHDLGSSEPELLERLADELASLRWTTVASPKKRPLTDDMRPSLRELGVVGYSSGAK